MSVCNLYPDKIVKDGVEYDSKLYDSLKLKVDTQTAIQIYCGFCDFKTGELISNIRQAFPDLEYDELGQPTLNSIMKIDYVRNLIEKNSLSKNEILKELNSKYKTGFHKTFNEVANILGSISRDTRINSKYTLQIVRTDKNGTKGFDIRIVEKTPENVAKLVSFLEQASLQDRMLVLAAEQGIASTIEELSDDVSGVYDTKKPQVLYNNMYRIIRLSANNLGNVGNNSEHKAAVFEELGHTIAAIWSQHKDTQEAYTRFYDTLSAKENRNILKYLGLTDQDIQEINNPRNKNSVEIVGKVIAAALEKSDGKLIPKRNNVIYRRLRSLLQSGVRFISSVINWLINGARQGVAYTARRFNGFDESNVKWYHKDLDKINIFESMLGDQGFITALERGQIKTLYDIKRQAAEMVNSFINRELDVNDALKLKQILHRTVADKESIYGKLSTAFQDFVAIAGQLGMFTRKTQIKLQNKHNEALVQMQHDANEGSFIKRESAGATFMESYIEQLKDVLSTVSDLMGFLTDDFRRYCSEAEKATEDLSEVIEAAVNIATWDDQLKIINYCRTALSLMNTIQDIRDRYRQDWTEDERTTYSQMFSQFEGITDAIKNAYNQVARGALIIELSQTIGGKAYIERYDQIMQIREKTGFGKGKKKLVEYKGRKILIRDLLEDLSEADGYFDFSRFTANVTSASKSIDPITQMLDQRSKASRQAINIENMRWQTELFNWRANFIRATGDANVDFLFEKDAKGKKTGNVFGPLRFSDWENKFAESRKEAIEKFKELNADKINNWSTEECMIEFQKFYQDKFNDFHEKNSIRLKNITWEELQEIFNIAEDENDLMTRLDNYRVKVNDEGIITTEYEQFAEEALGGIKYIPNETFINEQYQQFVNKAKTDEKTKAQLDFLRQYNTYKLELDAKVNGRYNDATVFWRIPQFKAAWYDRATQNFSGITQGVGQKIIDAFFVQASDSEFGNMTTYNDDTQSVLPQRSTLVSEVRNRVPTFGINKLYNMDQLSTDIFRSMMAYAAMANNIEGLGSIVDLAQIGRDVLMNRKVEGTSEKKRMELTGQTSNIMYRYDKFVEMQLFGQYASPITIDVGKNKQFSISKAARNLSRHYSARLLRGRVASGLLNTHTGIWQICKEAGVGDYFTYNEFWKALEIYNKEGLKSNFSHWSDGEGGLQAIMRTNWMYRYLQYMDAQTKNSAVYTRWDTKTPQFLKLNYAMMWYEDGDHLMHSLPYLMYGLHTKVYVKDENGKFIDTGKNLLETFKEHVEAFDKANTKANSSKPYGDPFTYYENGQMKRFYVKNKYAEAEEMDFLQGVTTADKLYSKIDEIQNTVNTLKGRVMNIELANSGTTKEDLLINNNYYKRQYRALQQNEDMLAKLEKQLDMLKENKKRVEITDITPELEYDELTNNRVSIDADMCRDLCDNMHGIYNQPDAVPLSQSISGSMILAMKKYMLGYYASQLLGTRDSVSQRRQFEGIASTVVKALYRDLFAKDVKGRSSKLARWSRVAPLVITPILSSAMLYGLHSVILTAIPMLLNSLYMSTFTTNKADIYGRNVLKLSRAQVYNLHRFVSCARWITSFHILSMLLGINNVAYKIGDDGDDDDDKEKLDEEGNVIEEDDGEFEIKEVTIDGKPTLVKVMKPKSKKKSKRGKRKEVPKTTQKIQKVMDEYNIDAFLLEQLGIWDAEDYKLRAATLGATQDQKGNIKNKLVGPIAVAALTESKEATREERRDRKDINGKTAVVNKISDPAILCGYAYWFMHRWEIEQSVFNPAVLQTPVLQAADEYTHQYQEILQMAEPVAIDNAIKDFKAVMHLFGKNQSDKKNFVYDKTASNPFEPLPKEEAEQGGSIHKFLYRINTLQHCIAGDWEFVNYMINLAPYLNSRSVFTTPYDASQSFDFYRTKR